MKITAISIIFSAILIGGAIFLSSRPVSNTPEADDNVGNVSVVDGKQVIEINAKGGYSPRQTFAKADIPTILRVATRGTFDCSSALMIPAINYKINLPPSGTTDIEIPPQKAGTSLQGLCVMGMFSFTVKFN